MNNWTFGGWKYWAMFMAPLNLFIAGIVKMAGGYPCANLTIAIVSFAYGIYVWSKK